MKLWLRDVYTSEGPAFYNSLVFLYQMLKERDPSTAISHERLPSFDNHVAFVNSHPYMGWYLIEDHENALDKEMIGNIYLTGHGEIGIHVKARYRLKGAGRWAVEELMRIYGAKRYFLNIAPTNEAGEAFRVAMGFHKCVQHTYECDTRPPNG